MSQQETPTPRTVVLIEKEELEGNDQPLPRVGDFWEKGKHRYMVHRVYGLASGGVGIELKGLKR